MKATILTVGTEILFGSIVNTNSVFLSQQLNYLGVDVLRHITVGDNRNRLTAALEEGFRDCDIILTTGGLGPTEDDLTKETIAEFFGKKLVENKKETQILEEWFSSQHRIMAENNRKQSWFPEGAEVLPNPHGTAPGFYLTDGRRQIFVMPGPPRENIPMFNEYIAPRLGKHEDGYLYYKIIRTIGIGESDLETKLIDLIDAQTDPTIATYAKTFECTLRVASKRPTLKEAENAVEEMMVKIRERIGQYIYSEENEELLAVVLKKIKEKGCMLASAESMTGGMFAKLVTDIPGASEVFERGIVTYRNSAKTSELDVSPETLDKYSAVSAQTAEEMVRGLSLYSGCRYCIAVTGYAGPASDDGRPVGLFYIAMMDGEKLTVKEYQSRRRTREDIRANACMEMTKLLYNALI